MVCFAGKIGILSRQSNLMVATLFFIRYHSRTVSTAPLWKTNPTNLTSHLDAVSNAKDSNSNEIQLISLPGGTYVGNSTDIKHLSLELSGERSNERSSPGTHIVARSESYSFPNEEKFAVHTHKNCIFSLTNSSLSLKSLHFSLVDNSEERRQQKNDLRTSRLAIVSDSMLTISESTIEVSSMTSAILISPSKLEEPFVHSSVVVRKCSISNEIGQLRGVVETEAFPAFGGSHSISLVGCSFNSQAILGTDGIGLSLTRTARKSNAKVGMISSSLISCSFVNMSSIGCSRPPHVSELSQTMLGCVVSLSSSHLSGSTIRDVNSGGSVLCSNSSFSSFLSSPNTDSNPSPSIILDGDIPLEYEDGKEFFFDYRTLTATSVSFSHCSFTGGSETSAHPLTFSEYPGSISVESCSFINIVRTADRGGALTIELKTIQTTNHVRIASCNFTNCSADQFGGALFLNTTAIVTVTGCRCVGCSLAASSKSIQGGGFFVETFETPDSTLSDLYFERCTNTHCAGALFLSGFQSTHIITSLFFIECSATSPSRGGCAGAMYLIGHFAEENEVSASHLKFKDCSADEAGGGLMVLMTQSPFILTDTELGGAVVGWRVDLKYTPIALKRTLFVGNTVSDTPTYFQKYESMIGAVQFSDFLIEDRENTHISEVSISDCWTTTIQKSVGMYTTTNLGYANQEYHRVDHPAFQRMGPFLTQKVEATFDLESWSFGLIVKGRVPLESQIYQVTMTEEEKGGAEITGQLQFSDGVGSLVPSSNLNLKFSATYTITSIVGIVPTSSELNSIPVTAEAWAFNLAGPIEQYSFTTPTQPPSLLVSTAHLTDAEEPEQEGPKKSQLPQEMKTLLSWLIPLGACLLLALLVAIFVIVLLRRRQKKNAEPAQKEMEAQNHIDFDEKMEVLSDDQTKDILHTDGRSHSAFDSSSILPSTFNPITHGVKSMSETIGDLVEVMACSGAFEVSLVGTYTLPETSAPLMTRLV
ncbi:hypothetical protein BLNAU_9921 [Blattamonas nauphoetae]|uniref:Uncharacterized protein n=1 Tax=Blattamonas nauphoetae TaxID=2049346 RepID=A0ABQ9XUN6_9EUKA|nr:hypothetical protein BLNAU_9921 [Blattamonas nauphoetae]